MVLIIMIKITYIVLHGCSESRPVALLSHQVKRPVDTEVTALMQASNNALSPACVFNNEPRLSPVFWPSEVSMGFPRNRTGPPGC